MAVLAELLETPYFVQGALVTIFAIFVASFWEDISTEIPYRRLPLVGKNWWELSNKKTRAQWSTSARSVISEGFAKGKNVFQVMSPNRPTVILHPKYVDEIKSHPDLNFMQAVRKNFFDNRIAGFEAFHAGGDSLKGNNILVDSVRVNLTQALGAVTTPLMEETAMTLKDQFPPTDDWTLYKFSSIIPYAVGRVSTLVFLGERAARNKEWVNVAVNYTIDAFMAARDLKMWPTILRPFVHHFLPYMHKLRQHLKVGRAIVQEEIERRDAIKKGLILDDSAVTKSTSLDWFEKLSAQHGEYFDFTSGQLGLALAAIHTTSNLLTNIMYDLAAHPEYIQPLRDEIKAVFAEDGKLKKTSLLKLKLMDSMMKETQRTHPVGITSMNRVATKDVVLSDGNVIPKGAMIAVSAYTVNEDDSIYPEADKYDAYRFLKKRQTPGQEHMHQFVTTTNQSFGFGHGVHACPGRFFAANETKIILLQLLLNYDWKFKEGTTRPQNFEIHTESIPDPTVELLFRARKPEVDLSEFYDIQG